MKKIIIAFLLLTVSAAAQWEFKQEYSHSADQVREVIIDSPMGLIECEPSADNNIYAYVKKVVYYDDKAEAEELANDCRVDFQVNKSTIEIIVDLPRDSYKHRGLLRRLFSHYDNGDIEILLRVLLPANIDLNLETASADVFVSDLKNIVKVRGASSDVCLENITGDISIKLASGDLKASEINGEIALAGSSSDFDLENIAGDMEISTSSGDGLIQAAKGNLDIATSSGDVKIFGLDGNLESKSTSGDISGDDISGSVSAKSTSGTISLKQLRDEEGVFYIETVSGDIYFEIDRGYDGRLEIETMSGEISSQIDMNIDTLSSTNLEGFIGRGSGKIQIITISGDILLENY